MGSSADDEKPLIPIPDKQPGFMEIDDVFVEKGYKGENDITALKGAGQSDDYWTGVRDMFKMTTADWWATWVGTILGSLISCIVIPAVLKAGIIPGTSQIVMVLAVDFCFGGKVCGNFARKAMYRGTSSYEKARYLLIVQAAGSASAKITFALCCAVAAGLLMEKKFRREELNQPEYVEKDTLNNWWYMARIVIACFAGTMTGAAWTNINIVTTLQEEDHPMPEAKASMSLIHTYADQEETDSEDETEGKQEVLQDSKEQSQKKTPKKAGVWRYEGLIIPCLFAMVSVTLGYLGFLPGAIHFHVKSESHEQKINNEWLEVGDGKPFGVAGSVAAASVFSAAYKAMLNRQKISLDVADGSALYGGIGALLSLRTSIAMLMGGFTYVGLNKFLAVMYEDTVQTSNYKDTTAYGAEDWQGVKNDVFSRARQWSGDAGDAYKWVGVTAIMVNTTLVLWRMMFRKKSASAKVQTGFESRNWLKPFNHLCFGVGYALTLVLLTGFSANVPMKLRFLMCVVTFILDYILNMVGGLQSLTVGASASPTSACLMFVGVVLGVLRLMELKPGDEGYDAEGAASDHAVFGIWVMRCFMGIQFTNDAAQDYATTQLMGHNVYVATRQNLVAAFIGAVLCPLSFWGFAQFGGEFANQDGYVTPQADTFCTLVDGINKGPMTGGIPWKTVGVGVVLGGLATILEVIGKRQLTHNSSALSRGATWLFRGFSCTGFALGIYLGTKTPFGCILSAGMVHFVGRSIGVRGREKNKELYLMAVAFIGGNAGGAVVKVFWILVHMAIGVENPVAPLWGWQSLEAAEKTTYAGGEWWLAKWGKAATGTNMFWEGIATIVVVHIAVYTHTKWGHEMEIAGQQVDSSSMESAEETDEEVDLRLKFLAEQVSGDNGINADPQLLNDIRNEMADLTKQKARINRISKRIEAAESRFIGDSQVRGWQNRNNGSVEHLRYISRRSGYLTFVALFVISAVGFFRYKDDYTFAYSDDGPRADLKGYPYLFRTEMEAKEGINGMLKKTVLEASEKVTNTVHKTPANA